MLRTQYPNVKLISNAFNYGFATAMNQGYHASQGKYIFSFNPDAEVFSNTLQDAISYMESHSTVGKVGLATINQNKVTLPYFEFEKYPEPHLLKMARARNEKLEHSKPFCVDWIFGTGLMIRRSALNVDRIYDEASFLFWEEYGLSKMIRANGFELHVLPDIKILHHASVSFKLDSKKIYWARLLGLSHEWRVRKEFYGRFNATVNLAICCVDSLIVFSALSGKQFFDGQNLIRKKEISDREARFKAAFKILIGSTKFISNIDREAKIFFNNGVYPVYPPVVN
jgi:GT2 family glycosyltransferase